LPPSCPAYLVAASLAARTPRFPLRTVQTGYSGAEGIVVTWRVGPGARFTRQQTQRARVLTIASGPLLGLFLERGDYRARARAAQPRGGAPAVLLYAAYEPAKVERAALRWFRRYLEEGPSVSLLKAQLALSALAELRAGDRELAEKVLIGLGR
jgi:hypothetical protein